MKLKYYGTSAAEGVPGLFCSCDVCEKSSVAGGRNIRTRSQALVNDALLIDFPPDTMAHVMFYGLDLRNIRNIIMTHNHGDHLLAYDFEQRRIGYAHLKDDFPLNVYGSLPACEEIKNKLESFGCYSDNRVILHQYQSFQPFELDGIFVTPLKANHDVRCDPHIFDIFDLQKRMLYANDTGYFTNETWDFLEQTKPYYHLVSLDCTSMLNPWRESHMGIVIDAEVKKRLIGIGCADENTKFIVHHFSHNGGATYDELVPIAAKYGFEVSYDTMEINF